MDNLRILIADDHPIFRHGLASILTLFNNSWQTFEASDELEFVQILSKHPIRLIFLESEMQRMDCMEATFFSRGYDHSIKIITLSALADHYHIKQMIDAGVNGYILKTSDKEEIYQAILRVLDGHYYLTEIARCKLQQKSIHPSDILSNREIEILMLICLEYTTKEIAEKLRLSAKTVEGHRTSIMEKTGSSNLAGVVRYAYNNGVCQVALKAGSYGNIANEGGLM